MNYIIKIPYMMLMSYFIMIGILALRFPILTFIPMFPSNPYFNFEGYAFSYIIFGITSIMLIAEYDGIGLVMFGFIYGLFDTFGEGIAFTRIDFDSIMNAQLLTSNIALPISLIIMYKFGYRFSAYTAMGFLMLIAFNKPFISLIWGEIPYELLLCALPFTMVRKNV